MRNGTGAPGGLIDGGPRVRSLLSAGEEVSYLDAAGNDLRRCVPGPELDERVAQIGEDGSVVFLHHDRQNSVIAITNAAGDAVARRGFGAYGEKVVPSPRGLCYCPAHGKASGNSPDPHHHRLTPAAPDGARRGGGFQSPSPAAFISSGPRPCPRYAPPLPPAHFSARSASTS